MYRETQAESEFREWLEAQPPMPPVLVVRDLDTRARIKQRKIDAAKRKQKQKGIPAKDVSEILFGHLR